MIHKAIYSLYPNATYINENSQAFDAQGNLIELNMTAVNAEVARLEAEFQAKEYARNRKKEYPPLTDLADALYHQSKGDETKLTAYLAKCEAVKQKYPKE